jgi:predicted  nucleic acid-binding Zn-ribbon protein
MTYPSYTKTDKDKLPHQCPHCGSPNGEWAKGLDNIMYCLDCDSTWFEYKDEWWSAFQKGRIIK